MRPHFPKSQLDSIGFGGGTPSLLRPEQFADFLAFLDEMDLSLAPGAEVSLEINPGTLCQDDLRTLKRLGFGRFSLGVQTFDRELLAKTGRRHSVEDSLQMIRDFQDCGLAFSIDLLFGLPGQTIAALQRDLEIIIDLLPQHVSPYILTIGKSHPMQRGRAPESEQIEMFQLIERRLTEAGYTRYELSNYAQPGFESKHNLLYWTDQSYLGLGVSAHSYFADRGPFGTRFWNSNDLQQYSSFVNGKSNRDWPVDLAQFETLLAHESLTDFCHISLRLRSGLDLEKLGGKFGAALAANVSHRCRSLVGRGWMEATPIGYRLSAEGCLLSNQVFSELTYLKSEVQEILEQPTVLGLTTSHLGP